MLKGGLSYAEKKRSLAHVRTTKPRPKKKCTQLTALRCVRNRDYAVAHRQGEDGTRVFTVSSILGLAEAEQCQAGPRHLSLSPCSILHKCSAGYQRLSRGLSQYRKAANASRTTDRPQTKYAG
jgi:hypothetical protein